jgi:hypothetical protein
MASLDTLTSAIEVIDKELRSLRKDVRKIRQHIEDPTGEKRAVKSQNNGFNKPQIITEELRAFLSLPENEKISRSQVNKLLNKYYETHDLKKGQNISLNAELKSLLQVPDGVQLTFLNMQKYVNRHYLKETPVVAAPVTKEKKSRPKVVKA